MKGLYSETERTQDTMYLPRMLQIDKGSIDAINVGVNFLQIDSKTFRKKTLVNLMIHISPNALM